ncbi:unnamed protein product [Hymenolepis diminuta]|uniref:Uncharacterized protein n=1 Tax=Hymenolepis diminuta TaxID=6216 RepID=A0A564YJ74_HYMDI|nr:unnamed protein product [Hymenolepis diminuta]
MTYIYRPRGPFPFQQSSDEYQKQSLPRCQFCGERRYYRNCPIGTATLLPKLQRQWLRKGLLPRIFYKKFNEAELEQQELDR